MRRHLLLLHGLFLMLILGLGACKSPKVATVGIEERTMDTVYVVAEPEDAEPIAEQLPPYNPSYTRTHDLLHTKLDVRFDWAKQHVIGQATLKLKPHFYPSDLVVLDAKGFDIKAVQMLPGKTDLRYDYDGEQISIQLGKTYRAEETYTLFIDYVAKPNEREEGGSAAITSDKGLFFINPLGEEAGKPKQIWTQGETEHNSAWFPTIDKPIERTTQEINVTVENNYKVLSNGVSTGIKDNGDGSSTWGFKMEQPHAPYLFMLAIGEFAVVKDQWENLPLEYWVEPAYEQDAKAIFSNTPAMLSFFSDKLGIRYPWPKYAQVVVRDYVSGAMENTTAVIFGEFVQRHERELIDDLSNERIVAHEMMHHWFGDLVTCESWANLTMNEGFANYSEYLWFEHQYGRDEADNHLAGEMSGYFGSIVQGGAHPLIHFGYNSKEDMFDAHSYNKGGAVLHMLRKYIGDEAFFASLKKYLEDNAYSDVEAHELRLAVEDVTGMDMNWFFNQWFFSAGHPSLTVSQRYDAATGEVVLDVAQTQSQEDFPSIFQLPVAIDIYLAEGQAPTRHNILINEREQSFRFKVAGQPQLVNFDAERCLLANISYEKSKAAYLFQFANAPLYMDRLEAMQNLDEATRNEVAQVARKGLKDPYHGIRAEAVGLCASSGESDAGQQILALAETDPHAGVRTAAWESLAEMGAGLPNLSEAAAKAIEGERAYSVAAAALNALAASDMEMAKTYAKKLEAEESNAIRVGLSNLYVKIGDPALMGFFEANLEKLDNFEAFTFYTNYARLLMKSDAATIVERLARLKAIAISGSQSPWRRISATKVISDFSRRSDLLSAEQRSQLRQDIEAIKASESNEQILGIYENF